MAEKKTSGKKCGRPSKAAAKTTKTPAVEHIGLVKNDSWLEPFEQAIRGRHEHVLYKLAQFTQKGKKPLADFATGHLYFGIGSKSPGGSADGHRAPCAEAGAAALGFGAGQGKQKKAL